VALLEVDSATFTAILASNIHSDDKLTTILNELRQLTPDREASLGQVDPFLIEAYEDHGNILATLSHYIDEQYRIYCGNRKSYIAPVGYVIQSTGTGKSRTLVEYCRRNKRSMYVVFPHMNKDHEEAQNKESQTWPFPLPCMHKFQKEMLRKYYSINRSDDKQIISIVQMFEMWLIDDVLLKYTQNRELLETNDLNDIVLNINRSFIDGVTRATFSTNLQHLLQEQEAANQSSTGASQLHEQFSPWKTQISTFFQRVELRPTSGVSQPFVVVIDEAGWISQHRQLYQLFRAALWNLHALSNGELFFVLASTSTTLTNYVQENLEGKPAYRPVIRPKPIDHIKNLIHVDFATVDFSHSSNNLRPFCLPLSVYIPAPNDCSIRFARPLWKTYYTSSSMALNDITKKINDARERVPKGQQLSYCIWHIVSHATSSPIVTEELSRSWFYLLDCKERTESVSLPTDETTPTPVHYTPFSIFPQDGLLSFFMLSHILEDLKPVIHSQLAQAASSSQVILNQTRFAQRRMLRVLYSALCLERSFLPHQNQSATGFLCEELLAICLIIGPRIRRSPSFDTSGYINGWVSLSSIFQSWSDEFGATHRDIQFKDKENPNPLAHDYSQWECRVYQVCRLAKDLQTYQALINACHSSAGLMASSERFSGGDILIPIRRTGDTDVSAIWSIQVRLNNTDKIGTSEIRDAMWKTDIFQAMKDRFAIRTAVFFSKHGFVQSIKPIKPIKRTGVHAGIWRVVNFDSRPLSNSPLDIIQGYLDLSNNKFQQDESAPA